MTNSNSNPSGRPSKFTVERRKAILDSISKRVPYIIAAEANGIGEETLYGWIRQGREDIENDIESEFAIFSEAIKKIEQDLISNHMDSVIGKPKHWQADAWVLERRWWKHFSSNTPIIEFNERLKKLEKGVSKNGEEMDSKSD